MLREAGDVRARKEGAENCRRESINYMVRSPKKQETAIRGSNRGQVVRGGGKGESRTKQELKSAQEARGGRANNRRE